MGIRDLRTKLRRLKDQRRKLLGNWRLDPELAKTDPLVYRVGRELARRGMTLEQAVRIVMRENAAQ